MKRIITGCLGGALLLGAIGCGPAGIQEGAPPDLTTTPLRDGPISTDMSGRMVKDMSKAAAKAKASAAEQPPAEKKE
jgi:hypothetical protein